MPSPTAPCGSTTRSKSSSLPPASPWTTTSPSLSYTRTEAVWRSSTRSWERESSTSCTIVDRGTATRDPTSIESRESGANLGASFSGWTTTCQSTVSQRPSTEQKRIDRRPCPAASANGSTSTTSSTMRAHTGPLASTEKSPSSVELWRKLPSGKR